MVRIKTYNSNHQIKSNDLVFSKKNNIYGIFQDC